MMNKNDQQFMAQKNRTQYMEKEFTELDALRALDARVKRPANVFAYAFGSISAIIMGAGNLGKALMTNFNFTKYGVRLVAAFDSNPQLIGTEIAGVPVYSCRELDRVMEELQPEIAILTLPKIHARAAAQRLVSAGIKGIWNFTSIDLHLDMPQVPVENVHFSESLMVLSYKIQ